MPDENIVVNVDASGSKAATDQLKTAIDSVGGTLDNLIVRFTEVNTAGDLVRARVTQIIDAYTRVTSTFKIVEGAIESVTHKIENNARAAAEASRIAREASAQQTTGDVLGKLTGGGIPANLPLDIIEKLQRAQSNFVKTIASSSIDDQTVKRVIDDLEKGLLKVESGPAAALQRAFLRLSDISKDIKEHLDKVQTQAAQAGQAGTAKTFVGQVSAQFPAPTAGSINQVLAYNNALAKLQTTITQSNLSQAQLNQLLQQAKAGPTAFAASISALPPNLQQVATGIAGVTGAAQQMGSAGGNAAKSLVISLEGILRLFQRVAVSRFIGFITNQFTEGLAAAQEFGLKLQQVANVGGLTGVAINDLSSRIRNLSETFGLPQIDVLRASQTALTGQLGDSARAFQVLENASKLSAATGIDVASSTKLLTTALQAYSLTGNDAARVSNLLFQTAQKVRVPIDELQNAFGRAGIVANRLGLDIEQTTAAFITLANQGTRPTEAFSLLNTVLARLLEPSKELQNLFNQWGTPTGQAAVATFGLEGVLNKLNETVTASPEKFNEIAGSMRALRAELGITGDNTIKLSKTIDDLKGGMGKLNDVAKETLKTPAQQMAQFSQQIKNYFTNDIGQSLVKFGGDFINTFGGISGVIGSFTAALKLTVTALIAYSSQAVIASAVTAAMNIQIGGSGVGFLAAAKAFITAAFSLTTYTNAARGLLGVLGSGGIGAGIAGLVAILATATIAVDTYVKRAEAAKQRLIDAQAEQRTQESKERLSGETGSIDKGVSDFNTQLNQRLQVVRQYFAQQISASKEARDNVISHQQDITNAIKNQVTAFTDVLKGQIADTRRTVEDAKTSLRNLDKQAANFGESLNRAFNQSIIGAESDPYKQGLIIQQQYIQNINAINALRGRTDKESRERQEQLFKDQEKLALDRFRADQSLARQRAEGLARFGASTGINPYTGQKELRYLVDTNKLERDRVDIIRLRKQTDDDYRAAQKIAIDQEQAKLDKQKQQLATVEQAAQNLEKFRAFDTEGRFSKDFRKQADPAKAALENFDKRAEDFKKLVEPLSKEGVLDFNQKRQLYSELAKQRKAIEDEIKAYSISKQIETDAARVESTVATAQKQRELLGGTAKEQTTEITDRVEKSRKAIDEIAKLFATSAVNSNPLIPSRESFEEEALRIGTIQKAIANAKTELTNFDVQKTANSAKQAAAAIVELKTAIEEFNVNRGKVLGEQDLFKLLGESGKSVQQLLERAGQNVDVGKGTAQGLASTKAGIAEADAALTQFNRKTLGVPDSFVSMGNAATNASTVIQQSMAASRTSIKNLTDEITALSEQLNKLNGATINVSVTGPVAQPKASGGPIWGNGPRGTDTIPAWLSPGEFVVNSRSTSRFFSQLMSINAGHAPRYYDKGGVVNNMGDINVNVTGQDTAEKTVREIGRQLQREIRRGNVILNP